MGLSIIKNSMMQEEDLNTSKIDDAKRSSNNDDRVLTTLKYDCFSNETFKQSH